MKLTEDNHSASLETKVVDWNSIEDALRSLDSYKKAYIVLTNIDGSYLQCAGGIDRLTIELQEINESGFKHFIIGKGDDKSALKTTWVQIDCRVGPIRVHDNEVLNLKDGMLIFRSFFQGDELPGGYKRRNVTKNFNK